MGERHGWLFEPTFNRSIKLRQADRRITSDAGALLLREVDHRLGLTADLAGQLYDPRDQRYIRYTQAELLRQHLYGLATGYVHQDDADTTAHDVAFKLATWDRPGRAVVDERLASQPSDWRLVDRLKSKEHRRALNEALATWVVAITWCSIACDVFSLVGGFGARAETSLAAEGRDQRDHGSSCPQKTIVAQPRD